MARLKAIVSNGRGKSIPAAEEAVQAFLDDLPDSVIDAFNAAHTEETTAYRDSRADEWRPLMDQAYAILDAHKGDVERPYLKVVRRGGRPPSTKTAEERAQDARARAAESKKRLLASGQQLNVILPNGTIELAKRLMAERGIKTMVALFETLIEEASKEKAS